MSFLVSMCCIISEDAEDCKRTQENTLRFQSFRLVARLDRLLTEASIKVDHEANDEEENQEGSGLAVHAPIIARSPGNATPCTSFLAGFFVPKCLADKHLGPKAPALLPQRARAFPLFHSQGEAISTPPKMSTIRTNVVSGCSERVYSLVFLSLIFFISSCLRWFDGPSLRC